MYAFRYHLRSEVLRQRLARPQNVAVVNVQREIFTMQADGSVVVWELAVIVLVHARSLARQ